jgi:hypothetical protein
MARPAPSELDEDTLQVPRAVKLPVELTPPEGFDPGEPATWPAVEGRLEWVAGRLLWMPPCADVQQDTVTDVVVTIGLWGRDRPEFAIGTNEAGMRLGEDSRGADAAVWRRGELGGYRGKFRHLPPVLAVEVSGQDESEVVLREKAHWYLGAGVEVVWLVLTDERAVVVLTPAGECRLAASDRIPEHPSLPGLAPHVADLFRQIGVRAPTPGGPR